MAKAAAAPSVRVEAITECHTKSTDSSTLTCESRLWVHERWQGRFGSLTFTLALSAGTHAHWSQAPTVTLGAQTVTRTITFDVPQGQAVQLRATGIEEVWTLWRLDVPRTACPMANVAAADILAQPLKTPLHAKGWILAARNARTRPGVDFAATAPQQDLRTMLIQSDGTPICLSDSGQLHVEPQSNDPYVQVMGATTQILVTLPLATIP